MLKQIEKDMMEALKNKEREKAGALRLLISRCKNKAIEVGHELSDPEVIKVLQSAAKQHKESIRMYKEGNRDDLVETEMTELQFVESYFTDLELLIFQKASDLVDRKTALNVFHTCSVFFHTCSLIFTYFRCVSYIFSSCNVTHTNPICSP